MTQAQASVTDWQALYKVGIQLCHVVVRYPGSCLPNIYCLYVFNVDFCNAVLTGNRIE